ncbi:MAG: HEAT repeat domain-containing protein [Planctomycetes bacterium]|nr:HEAT repeat domain-containing protein [Planctomycetota bacterium]
MSARHQSATARSAGTASAALLAILALGGATRLSAQVGSGAVINLLADDDPTLRGEAALIAAAQRAPGARDAIRKLLADRDESVRARAILALGILAAAGADAELGPRLADREAPPIVRHAAAYALGCLPDDQPAPSIDRYLDRAEGGSRRRHRDTLAALLAGLLRTPHSLRLAQVESLLHDASLKDPGLLVLALRAQRHCGGTLDDADFDRMIAIRDTTLRVAAIESVAFAPTAADPEVLAVIRGLADRDADPKVRAAVIAALAAHGRDAAMHTLLREALASDDVRQVEAATRALASFDDDAARAAVSDRVRSTSDIVVQRAILRGWRGTPTTAILAAARAFGARPDASAADQALGLRVLAAAHEADARTRAVDFARHGTDPALVADALAELVALDRDADLRAALAVDAEGAFVRLPVHIEALGRVDRALASALADRALADPAASAATRRGLVTAWRRALWSPPPVEVLAALPEDLAALLR